MIDFPVDKIEFDISEHGTGRIQVFANGVEMKSSIITSDALSRHNEIKIVFTKKDPADVKSFATINRLLVNDIDFTDSFKKLEHNIDQTKHKNSVEKIPNNCYFGFVGETTWSFEQPSSYSLQKASWLIVNDHFSSVRHPYKGSSHKQKTFTEIKDQAKHLYAGLHPCKDQSILEYIEDISVRDSLELIDTNKLHGDLIDWMDRSSRVKITGLEQFNNMTVSNGVSDCLASFIYRNESMALLEKKYQFTGDLIEQAKKTVTNVIDGVEPMQNVLLEFPSVHYDSELLKDIIRDCREKDCHIALDLTFLPVSTHPIDIDLSLVDEFYIGLAKTWSLYSIRPAVRFSKKRINDNLTWLHDHNYFSTIGPNVLQRLIKKFPFDHTVNKFQSDADDVIKTFDLQKTNI